MRTHDDKSLCPGCNYYDLSFQQPHHPGCFKAPAPLDETKELLKESCDLLAHSSSGAPGISERKATLFRKLGIK